ncbi:MAG: urease accessory protein UreD [Verrucomicrobiota bacterium]|nr:urease accessory protein UreD [Verrucomicrobiota bacterium]
MENFKGRMELTAALRDDGQTYLAHQFHQGAFHLSKPYWDGRVLRVQVTNPTAGMLEGDRLEQTIRVGSGASLLVSTPAQSRAFRVREGCVTSVQHLTVDGEGWLDYYPEPLVPHTGCDYCQQTKIEVFPEATLIYCDAFAPGRTGRGEAWGWKRLEISLNVRLGGVLVLRERFDLAAAHVARQANIAGMETPWFASVLIIHPEKELLASVMDTIRELHSPPHFWLGASEITQGGWYCRLIASDGQRLRDGLTTLRTRLATIFTKLPATLRKY